MKKYIKPNAFVVALHTKPMMVSASGDVSGLGSSNSKFTGTADSRRGSIWDEDEEDYEY